VLPPVIFLFAFFSFFVIGFEILFECFVFSKTCIKSVFDIIIYTTWHVLLYLDPLVAIDFVELHQLKILSNGPFLFVQVWVDIIIPSLPTLLTYSSGQKGSDFFPLFKAIFSNLLFKNHVFFWGPVTFDLLDSAILSIVSQKKPPIHALNLGLFLTEDGLLFGRHINLEAINKAIELFVYRLDVLHLIGGHKLDQIIILSAKLKFKQVVLTYSLVHFSSFLVTSSMSF